MITHRNLHIAVILSALFIAGCNGSDTPEERLQTMTREVSEKFTDVPQLSTADLATWLKDPDRKYGRMLREEFHSCE